MREGHPKGSPSLCHPERPTEAKGLCRACYLRKRRANGYVPRTHDAIDWAVIAELADITPAQAKAVIRAMLSSMKAALQRGESVVIRGFGKWVPIQRKGHRIGGLMGVTHFPTKKTVRFIPYPVLDYMVNPHQYTSEEPST